MRLRQIGFVHVGIVGALVVAGITSVGLVSGAGAVGGTASSFVRITPCRLLDTRTGTDNVGTRAAPFDPSRDGDVHGVGHQRQLHHPDDGNRHRHERNGGQSDSA